MRNDQFSRLRKTKEVRKINQKIPVTSRNIHFQLKISDITSTLCKWFFRQKRLINLNDLLTVSHVDCSHWQLSQFHQLWQLRWNTIHFQNLFLSPTFLQNLILDIFSIIQWLSCDSSLYSTRLALYLTFSVKFCDIFQLE